MLNDDIVSYLTQKGIAFSAGDYATASENGVDGIVVWDDSKLGPQPTQDDLDAASVFASEGRAKEANKALAMRLLQQTDWVEMHSVSDASLTPHLLNKADFIAYRTALRAIAVNPPGVEAVFPAAPAEQWTN